MGQRQYFYLENAVFWLLGYTELAKFGYTRNASVSGVSVSRCQYET
jgi:hypothetical protein